MSEPQLFPVYFDRGSIEEDKLKKIRNYFQIQRKSGGGDCSYVTNYSEQVYQVLFKDKQAQQRVLARREHEVEVGGSSLVLIVRDSPDSAASPPKRHSSSTSSLNPGGVEHEVKVDVYLLQYLRDCSEAKNDLDRALRPLQSSATLYPDRETTLVKTELPLDDDEAAKTWKTEVERVIEGIKKLYLCHFEVKGELRSLLLKSCNKCQEEDEVKVYSESEVAVVVGTPGKVQARLEHVEICHVKTCASSQRQSQTCRIDRAKYRLLKNEILQSLARDVPDLEVKEAADGRLDLKGTVKEISKAHDIIDEKEQTVKESTVSDLSKHFLTFLAKAYSSGDQLGDFLGRGEGVVIELKPTQVKILALSEDEIEQTEKALREKFREDNVEVPDCSEVVLELQNSLKSMVKTINENRCKVYTAFVKNTVVLVGQAPEVKQLHEVVSGYILDQSNIEHQVVVPFQELAQRLPEFLKQNGIDFTGVNFRPLQSGVVALEGPSSAVNQVGHRLRRLLESVVRESLILDMPGARRYFKTQNGAAKLLDVADSHKCLVQVKDDATTANEQEEVVARYVLKNGVQVIVYLGDITKHEADALVNAANEELRHGGGVASALSAAAGPEVQKESSELVKAIGKIVTGSVVVTGGGNLKCKKLLHAVGPEKRKAGGRERELLKLTVKQAFNTAEEMYFSSIALPCISSGVFGVPVDVCAEAIVSAVRAFSAVGGRSLTKITLIDNRREVVRSLKAQCDRQLQSEAVGDAEGPKSQELQAGAAGEASPAMVRVAIVQGTIENQTADCIVCPMLGHQPTSTRLGQALHAVAGDALITRFHQSAGGATNGGDSVLVEDVPRLLSKAVIFLNLMVYSSQQQEAAKQVLRQSIKNALNTCAMRCFSSVTFPVTGPGGMLQIPHNMAALVLLQEIKAFEQRRAAKTPFEIRVVIHPNDKDSSKAFQAAQQTEHLKGFTNDANPNKASFYRHVSSAHNEVTAQMGNVKLQVVQGDIVHEKTDVIVNSTSFQRELLFFNNIYTGVSKAILTAAGPNVQAELKRAGVPANLMCSTGAGLLGCKEIVHVQTDPRDPQTFHKTCKEVLKLCEGKGYTSAAFPAINTGIGGMDFGKASTALLDGMASAITKLNLQSVSLIRIVILQQPVFDAFRAELENRFGQLAPPPNIAGKFKNLMTRSKAPRSRVNIPPTKPQPMVCTVITSSSAAVTAVKKALEDLVQQQLVEREFELRDLCLLSEMGVEAVQHKSRVLGVSLDHSMRRNTDAAQSGSKNQTNPGEKIVVLRGLKDDVMCVAELVNKAIHEALRVDLEKKDEEELAQSVQWMHRKGEEDWEDFPLHENYVLEDAHQLKHVFVKMEIKKNKVKVNLKNLEATDKKTGDIYRLKRCERDTEIELPGYWKPMAGENFKKVEVEPNTQEYQDIAKGFYRTAKYKIHKIERVQNYDLWCSYFVMRRKMEMKNGVAELGEKYLYHGTSKESCHCIERDRFDRSYTGQHAACYGAGVYFAVKAEYSTNPTYSKPDSDGLRRMYVARVLTGRHTLGSRSMIVPPARGDDPSDKYDSLVDNLQNPNMFVIFHDDQAYPEYLITFR